MNTWKPGAHIGTFRGHVLAYAAGAAALRFMVDCHLAEHAERLGEAMLERLKGLERDSPVVGDVRGKGLMIGVEFVRNRETKERATTERDQVVQEMFKRGVLILGAGRNALRFAPPMVFTKDQADTAVRILDDALGAVTGRS